MSDAVVELRGVSKAFGEKVVLDAVDLSVRRGEVLVILGGSGSGKSVSLRHMNGLTHPDAGEVFVDGLEVSRLAEEELVPVRKKVGMLFQMGALFDSMTVFENVAFALWEHTRMTDAEVAARVAEVLGFVNLGPEVMPLLPSSLSGGMKKRVSLARTIALKPDVLLYDEPTTGLDPIRSDGINELIIKLKRRLKVTSIVVTHDLTSARKVADRVVMLQGGKVIADGTYAQLEKSSDPHVQHFLLGQYDRDEDTATESLSVGQRPPLTEVV